MSGWGKLFPAQGEERGSSLWKSPNSFFLSYQNILDLKFTTLRVLSRSTPPHVRRSLVITQTKLYPYTSIDNKNWWIENLAPNHMIEKLYTILINKVYNSVYGKTSSGYC